MQKMFFDWGQDSDYFFSLSHLKFRLVTIIFLIMACALFLFRVSYLSTSSLVLSASVAMMALLLIAGVRLIFTKQLLFSKLTMFASLVLFQAVEFGQSPVLNLTPLTPQLVGIVIANLAFVVFLTMIRD